MPGISAPSPKEAGKAGETAPGGDLRASPARPSSDLVVPSLRSTLMALASVTLLIQFNTRDIPELATVSPLGATAGAWVPRTAADYAVVQSRMHVARTRQL